jgi:hypothetical protein
VIEVDDMPVGKFIQKLPIVSGAVSNADDRCLGKLFDYDAQLFAHFPIFQRNVFFLLSGAEPT